MNARSRPLPFRIGPYQYSERLGSPVLMGTEGGGVSKEGGRDCIVIDLSLWECVVFVVWIVEILLHVVVSASAGAVTTSVLMHTRGVRGLRVLHRDLLDLESDHNALTKRLKKMQTSAAGEASAESKKVLSKATLDFVAKQQFMNPGSQYASGQ